MELEVPRGALSKAGVVLPPCRATVPVGDPVHHLDAYVAVMSALGRSNAGRGRSTPVPVGVSQLRSTFADRAVVGSARRYDLAACVAKLREIACAATARAR